MIAIQARGIAADRARRRSIVIHPGVSHGHRLVWLAWVTCSVACGPPPAPREVAPAMTVPTGVWQRDWIRRGGAAPDASVVVRYVQTPSVFGDVRTPAARPAVSHAASFAELTDDELAELAGQQGFAGTTTVDGTRATWHHEIDFQPASDDADVGRVEPAGDGKMFEHALDDSYVESWSALDRDATGGKFLAVRVVRDGKTEQLLAVAGTHFVYARARDTPLPAARSIREAIAQNHATRDQIIAYLDCEISYGRVADWQIERSTLPWQQGKRLAFADQIAIDAGGQPTSRAAEPGEAWSVPVNTMTAVELEAVFAPR
jgi:hypothetical protein